MNNLINNTKYNFTRVPNKLINDKSLSAKAKGIFTYLMSKPDDWNFYLTEICAHFTDGKTAIQSGIKELEDAGYLKRKRKMNKLGRFEGWVWIIDATDNDENRQTENPPDGKPDRRKTLSYNKTDDTKTNNTNTDNIHAFAQFWELYDKKVDRKRALQRWGGLKQKDIDAIMEFVPIYKKSVRHKQYMKNPDTFLNSRIWEDDWNEYKPYNNERLTGSNGEQLGRTESAYKRFEELFG